MQKILTAAAAATAALIPFAGQAHALDAYGKISIGDVSDASAGGFDLNGGLSYGAAIGVDDFGPFRLELGAERLSGEALAGAVDAHAWTYTGTVFIDLRMSDDLTLFGGAGLNYSNASANFGFGSASFDGDGHHFTVGGDYAMSERLSLEISYTDYTTDYGSFTLDAGRFGAALRFDL